MKCFKHGVLNTMHTVSASGFNLCFARLVFDNEKLQATERKHCFVEFTLNKQRIKNHV